MSDENQNHGREFGAALRSLTDPPTPHDFWTKLEQRMAEVDGHLGSEEIGGEETSIIGRWQRNRGRILLAAAVLAMAEHEDDARRSDDDAADDTADEHDGIPDRAERDYRSAPKIVTLEPGSTVIGGSRTADALLATVPVPDSEGSGCEGAGRFSLAGIRSDGLPIPVSSAEMDYNVAVPGPDTKMVFGRQCEGLTELVAIGSFRPTGGVVITQQFQDAYVTIPNMVGLNDPVWAAGGSIVRMTGSIADGSLLLISFGTESGRIVDTTPIAGRLLAEFNNGARAIASDEGLSVAGVDVPLLDADVASRWVGAELDADGELLAAWNGANLRVIGDTGEVAWEGRMNHPVSDATWTTDGLLLAVSSTTSDMTVIDIRPGGVTTPVSFTELGPTGWFNIVAADHGRVVALSRFGPGDQVNTYLLRFGDSAVGSITPGDLNEALPTSGPDDAAEADADTKTKPGPGGPFSEHRLTLRRLGPIEIGMTVSEAAAALNQSIDVIDYDNGTSECHYGSITGDDNSPVFMVRTEPGVPAVDGVIARIELKPGQATSLGIAIGSPVEHVMAAYGGQIEVSTNRYTNEDVLTYVPAEIADANHRLVMETVNGKVSAIRAGRLPEVEWVEGCS